MPTMASRRVVSLLLLLTLAISAVAAVPKLHSGTFYSPTFDMSPGDVAFNYFYGVDFPKGHLALKSFKADVVDENDNIIPYHEVYLHHSYIVPFHQARNYTIPPMLDTEELPYSGDGRFIFRRNTGMCQTDILGQIFGLGTEMQQTATNVPEPYGIEIGNPDLIPDGFDEKWMLVVHGIDTRGAVDPFGCTECRKDLYNVTVGRFGEPLTPEYLGGLSCCYAHTGCKVRKDYNGHRRTLRMRYKLTWTEWNPTVIPVRAYIVDVTDDMKLSVSSDMAVTAEHDCQLEYNVEGCGENVPADKCVNTRRNIVHVPKGGNVVFGLAHMHAGSLDSTLYGQDGRVLCNSKPIYGEGAETGYVIGMSTCYPEPGSVVIHDGELLVHEAIYSADRSRTGVMALFYFLVADREPETATNNVADATASTTTASSSLRLRSMMSGGN